MPPRRNRLRRLLLALVVGAVVAAISGEILLRFFLFHPSAFAIEHGKGLREANFYGDRKSDDDVWKLEWAMNDAGRLHDAPNADRLLGWTVTVAPATYAHPDAELVGTRTPVLLFGDSFARGETVPEASFQALLASSDLGATHALVNYGAGGYGLDQILLLLRATIDAWGGRNPIVLVGCFIDDDLDRSVLTFRSWPKPRFHLEGQRLIQPEPVETDVRRFLDAHPSGIRSYLWRFIKYRRHLLPRTVQVWLRGGEQRVLEKRALNRALLVAIHSLLEEKHVRHALVLFQGENGLERSPGCEWQEDFAIETCRGIALPFISTRTDLETAARTEKNGVAAFFQQETAARGHYNARGNEVAFRSLRRAIEGRFE